MNFELEALSPLNISISDSVLEAPGGGGGYPNHYLTVDRSCQIDKGRDHGGGGIESCCVMKLISRGPWENDLAASCY